MVDKRSCGPVRRCPCLFGQQVERGEEYIEYLSLSSDRKVCSNYRPRMVINGIYIVHEGYGMKSWGKCEKGTCALELPVIPC